MQQRALPLPPRQPPARPRRWGLAGVCLAVALLMGWVLPHPPPQIPTEGPASAPASDRDLCFQLGDDPRWAQPDWNDADWQRRPQEDPPAQRGVLWARLRVSLDTGPLWALKVTAAAAREVYWDGVLIGRAGEVGHDAASEVPGPIDANFPIPEALRGPGEHVVALRFSNFRRAASTQDLLLNIELADLRNLTAAPYRKLALPVLFLGGYVLVALYYGALFLADRRRTGHLWTALLCLAVASLLVAEGWRQFVGYPYPLHGLRLGIIDFLTWCVGFLLVAALSVPLRLRETPTLFSFVASAHAALLLSVADHETGTYAVFALTLVVALAITAWAAVQGRPGARLACLGVGVCFSTLIWSGRDFMDGAFFPAFGFLMATILISLGLQTKEREQRYALAKATAARLEAELLKKHLQPHFLMNTLTSVLEWVETDPARGARAIEALASELRSLTEVSGHSLIEMRAELALCRAHLEVMGFRRAVSFALETMEVDEAGLVPPAVIHTLVENALTHNAYGAGHVVLYLEELRDGHRRRLILRAPLAKPHAPARPPHPEGGGLRYVRARLEEAFPGAWHLESGPQEDHWVTQMEIPSSRELA